MKNKHLAVINIVGLTKQLIGEHTPRIYDYAKNNFCEPMDGVFPALTTTAQASMLTGVSPDQHGIVGNGWYDRDFAEVAFWKQPNQLMQADKIWHQLKARDKSFTCSQLFWWYNMYADVEASITPRPHYPADGRKIIDLYSRPKGLHQSLEKTLGAFPFFNFWGPKAGIESSRWIAEAAMLEFDQHKPNLQLVYLPHLDYCLQKFGPSDSGLSKELRDIDSVVGKLIEFYLQRGVDVALVSEYGLTQVDKPIYLNRVLREQGFIEVRDSVTWELLDPGASPAFAVVDHQIAHVYVNDASKITEVKKLLEKTEGIERVLDHEQKREWKINHERAGDLVAIAEPSAWFCYYYWLDDDKAPDFARTVDIHRKPGYDPVEMFVDPKISFPMVKVLGRLLQKKLGFRMLMDVIPLDAGLIKGSHGRPVDDREDGPLVVLPKSYAVERMSMLDFNGFMQRYFLV